jgi:hypothetical protein
VRTVPRLYELHPGICLTTEKKASLNLSQGKKNLPYCYTIFKIANETKTPVGSTRGDLNGAAEEVGVREYYIMRSGK